MRLVDCPTRWSLWYWYLDFYVYISLPKWPRNIVQQCATWNCEATLLDQNFFVSTQVGGNLNICIDLILCRGQIELWKFRPFLRPKVLVPKPAGFAWYSSSSVQSARFYCKAWKQRDSWENTWGEGGNARGFEGHSIDLKCQQLDEGFIRSIWGWRWWKRWWCSCQGTAKHEIVYLVNPPPE